MYTYVYVCIHVRVYTEMETTSAVVVVEEDEDEGWEPQTQETPMETFKLNERKEVKPGREA